MPLFGTLADQSAVMTGTGLPVDTGHTAAAAAVGMNIGYPAAMNMNVNDVRAMMMMSDVYHGNPQALDQSAVKHMLHSVTDAVFCFHCCDNSCCQCWLCTDMSLCRSFVNSADNFCHTRALCHKCIYV